MNTILLSLLLVGSGNGYQAREDMLLPEVASPSPAEGQVGPEYPFPEPVKVVPARELMPDYDPNEWDWAYEQEGHKA